MSVTITALRKKSKRVRVSNELRIYLAVVFLLTSCASAPKSAEAPARPAQQTFQIINLGPAFTTFWALAQGKRFTEQVKIWERIVEKPEQPFYDSMVWVKKELPNWKERRTRLLKKYFSKYRKLAPRMNELFTHFDETLADQIERFQKIFPDSQFTLPVYAAPTASFNGRASEGVAHGEQPILAFGVDLIADFHNNPDVLYSHELFHVYHNSFLKLESQSEEERNLTIPLWMEGFATYVSLKMDPSAPLSSVFMSKELPKLKQKEIPWLARAFLKDLRRKRSMRPTIYQKWFNMGSKIRPRKGLPDRCGYLLGFYVVAHLVAGNHSVDEMVHWDVKTAEAQVIEALKEL